MSNKDQATEQEGKKVYSITEEGKDFLEIKKDVADNVKSHVKNRWSLIGRFAHIVTQHSSNYRYYFI